MNVMAKELDFNVNLEGDIDAEIKAFIGSTKSKKQKMSLIQIVIVLAQVDPKFLTIQPVKHLYLYFLFYFINLKLTVIFMILFAKFFLIYMSNFIFLQHTSPLLKQSLF